MQHLREYGIGEIPVADYRPPHWVYRADRKYTVEYFRGYPAKHGWEVGTDYKLKERANSMNQRVEYHVFLQQWLWFGLLHTVLDSDSRSPALEELSWASNNYVTTIHLSDALDRWTTFEKQNRKGAKLRLMMAESVLEHARRVVRANLAYEPAATDESVIDVRETDTSESMQADRRELDKLAQLQQGHPQYISHALALSIMVLGEALSAHKTQIAQELGITIQGWNSDKGEDTGWGPPKYALLQMERDEWCKRSVRLLRGQLGSNATLFLAALKSDKKSREHGKYGCTAKVCNYIPAAEKTPGRYEHQHAKQCQNRKDCFIINVESTKLHDILQATNEFNMEENFPVFQYNQERSELRVKSWYKERAEFASISHIWSDGLGNELSNGVYRCQLNFINNLLAKVSNNEKLCQWFWLDTLGIPRRPDGDADRSGSATEPRRTDRPSTISAQMSGTDDFTDAKRKAIGQIAHIYKKANHAIVIDQNLHGGDAGEQYAKIAMKILTSGWMRRLWTLQEAYLSNRLTVIFRQQGDARAGNQDLDELFSHIDNNIMRLVRQKLLENTMGIERNQRLCNVDPLNAKGSYLIANAWRAVRWRSTSKAKDETLALATLLNLPIGNTRISSGSTERVDEHDQQTMMSDFWKLLHRHYTGSIPPGIIFLPGKKLDVPGFRWAPTTWMSSVDEDHPHPLGIIAGPTELREEGLLVRYPGFLLHCQDVRKILGSDFSNNNGFKFPVDGEFHEWYEVEAADKLNATLLGALRRETEDNRDSLTQFAIIVSRPYPRDILPEIGLLVKVDEIVRSRSETDGLTKDVYHCRIVHRVRVRRTFRGNTNVFGDNDSEVCYGEAFTAVQDWIVDGFEKNKGSPEAKHEPGATKDVEKPALRATERDKRGLQRYIEFVKRFL